MKKRITVALITLFAALCSSTGLTACEDKESLEFTLTGNSYSVTGIGTVKSDNIIIPSVYNGKKVTTIGETAFIGCKKIKSISIPDGVTSIGDFAFFKCSGLTDLTVPDSLTFVGELAFAGCDSLNYYEYDNGLYLGNSNNKYIILAKAKSESITSCMVNEKTKILNSGAFYECDELVSVTVYDGLTSVGGCAFGLSEKLQYSEYENGLYLGNADNPYLILYRAKDEEITSCTVNEKTKYINGGAFSTSDDLTEITFSDSVCNIGNSAFSNCNKLKGVNISSLTNWCGIKFDNDEANPLYFSHSFNMEGKQVEELIIPDNVNVIEDRAFVNCSEITSVTIPAGVVTIGNSAFSGCSKLSSVSLTDGLISIGSEAFGECSGLSEIFIPESVAYIGDLVFDGCKFFTIYCQSSACPTEWQENWNKYSHNTGLGNVLYEHQVVWNYKK